MRHTSEAFVRHAPEAIVRHASEAVVRHASEAFVRHAPEAIVRHASEAVVRRTSEAQLSSLIEHNGVAAIHLPDSQQHLLRVCSGVPLLLNEGCLVLPAQSGHCAFQSNWFTHVLTRHSLSYFYLVERHVAEMAWLKWLG